MAMLLGSGGTPAAPIIVGRGMGWPLSLEYASTCQRRASLQNHDIWNMKIGREPAWMLTSGAGLSRRGSRVRVPSTRQGFVFGSPIPTAKSPDCPVFPGLFCFRWPKVGYCQPMPLGGIFGGIERRKWGYHSQRARIGALHASKHSVITSGS